MQKKNRDEIHGIHDLNHVGTIQGLFLTSRRVIGASSMDFGFKSRNFPVSSGCAVGKLYKGYQLVLDIEAD